MEAVLRENEFVAEQLKKKKGIAFAEEPGAPPPPPPPTATIFMTSSPEAAPVELSEAVKIGMEAGNINISTSGAATPMHQSAPRLTAARGAGGALGERQGGHCAPPADDGGSGQA